MRSRLRILLIAFAAAIGASNGLGAGARAEAIAARDVCVDAQARDDAIERHYLGARFDEARAMAEAALACASVTSAVEVTMLLHLARIEDRIGLSQNTRSAGRALPYIDRAEARAATLGAREKAAVALVRAQHVYGAGNAQSRAAAEALARSAAAMFAEAGDKAGEADAVHLLGLIRFQQRQNADDPALNEARALFDRSLALDQEGGPRQVFCGDYHRHVGFIDLERRDFASAISNLRQSVACRRAAGALDGTMFGLHTLAEALVQSGDVEAAFAPLLEGLLIANDIGSPVGTARLSDIAGQAYEAIGNTQAACRAFQTSLAAAQSVAYASYINRAQAAADRLCSTL